MRPDGHVAFKLTRVYGKGGPFTSPCTAQGRETNISVERKVWCRQRENECYQAYAAGNGSGPVGGSPCYDVRAFRDRAFSAGVYHNGPRRDQPIPIRFAKVGKLAFLTSKQAGAKKSERVVLGFFEITRIGRRNGSMWVSGKGGTQVPNSLLHKAPRFWQFYRQSGPPRWGSGLFRYMSDRQATRLKKAVRSAAGKG